MKIPPSAAYHYQEAERLIYVAHDESQKVPVTVLTPVRGHPEIMVQERGTARSSARRIGDPETIPECIAMAGAHAALANTVLTLSLLLEPRATTVNVVTPEPKRRGWWRR